MVFFLNQREIAVLFRQNPRTSHQGGFQWFLVQLQRRTNVNNGRIFLTHRDVERIHRYAFRYGNGGWENRLMQIFSRVLGQQLILPSSNNRQLLLEPPVAVAA